MLGRIGIANIDRLAAARAVLRGAVALYLTRDLNVLPAHIPGEVGSGSTIFLPMRRRSGSRCRCLRPPARV